MATNDRTFPAVSIKTRILLSFLALILVLSVLIAALGCRVIKKDIIGILYVGILEQPFNDRARQIFLWFLLVVGGVTIIAVLLSFILAGAVSRPLTQVVHASECLASGDWGCRITANTAIKEIDSMAEAFNAMALGLKDRQECLRISNEKLADSDLMQIVANNLVSNAIKYSPDAGQIRLTATQTDGKVEVDVYNDSTPMTEEQMGKLFHKFSRLDNPETKKVKGTGLGLYITKQIIERHGGNICVKPRENGNSSYSR